MTNNVQINNTKELPHRVLSLFANIGIAEAYFKELGIEVSVANELIPRRANLYKQIYPETDVVIGDILDNSVFDEIINKSRNKKIDIVMATPPCQGMSRAGHQDDDDERNNLIISVLTIVKKLKPRYVFIENVNLLLETEIVFKKKKMLIPDVIKLSLGRQYEIDIHEIDTKYYSVPQTRERVIFLMTRKDLHDKWELPKPDDKIITLQDAIGHLPPLDPFVKDLPADKFHSIFPKYEERRIEALKISPWHCPPVHIWRQVEAMIHTPTGKTAMDNPVYYPKKANGDRVQGYKSTYRRLQWKAPASTVTMDNRKISSQNNVHPGRYLGTDKEGTVIYSDPRALTVYELMKVTSLPDDWPVPVDTPNEFLRSVIGEGIPPLFTKKVFAMLPKRGK